MDMNWLLLVILFVVLHFLMHRGHGGHGGSKSPPDHDHKRE